MATLQRSSRSFRREGSSGLVWDDKLLLENMSQTPQMRMELRHCQSTCSHGALAPMDQLELRRGGGSPSNFPRSLSTPVADSRSPKATVGLGFPRANGKPPIHKKFKFKNKT
ncbi:uncharacterized protein At1g15400-like [Diospyros lotus]|uniref:uncharacterized protein At1g15400-like n=1 Tax=Diospyros lotus TaxID=55363 RepID=UPI00225B741B|nr:uncharacterized protein At1g15400-like [Diospyros lotus]